MEQNRNRVKEGDKDRNGDYVKLGTIRESYANSNGGVSQKLGTY